MKYYLLAENFGGILKGEKIRDEIRFKSVVPYRYNGEFVHLIARIKLPEDIFSNNFIADVMMQRRKGFNIPIPMLLQIQVLDMIYNALSSNIGLVKMESEEIRKVEGIDYHVVKFPMPIADTIIAYSSEDLFVDDLPLFLLGRKRGSSISTSVDGYKMPYETTTERFRTILRNVLNKADQEEN